MTAVSTTRAKAPHDEVSVAVRRRRAWARSAGLVAAVVLLGLLVLVSLSVGSKEIPLGDVWAALFGNPPDDYTATVVESRIPRTLLAVVVGAALAVAGAVMQGITRNPLGDPGLLGVNSGAAATVVTSIAFFGVSAAGNVWVALPGAVAAVVIVYAIGHGRGHGSPARLVLAGAVVTAVFSAYVQAISLSFPDAFAAYRFWVIGSVAGRGFDTFWSILPFIVVGLVLCLSLVGPLNALALGEDSAVALGARPGVTRLVGGAGTTLLAAASTAGVGPIGFVGLAVPHIVRALIGGDHRWLLPFCVVLGPALVLTADVVGRVIARPDELMVGVITAFIGAPVLFVVVRRLGARA